MKLLITVIFFDHGIKNKKVEIPIFIFVSIISDCEKNSRIVFVFSYVFVGVDAIFIPLFSNSRHLH